MLPPLGGLVVVHVQARLGILIIHARPRLRRVHRQDAPVGGAGLGVFPAVLAQQPEVQQRVGVNRADGGGLLIVIERQVVVPAQVVPVRQSEKGRGVLRVQFHGPLERLHRRFIVERILEAAPLLVMKFRIAVVRLVEGADPGERFFPVAGLAQRLRLRHAADECVLTRLRGPAETLDCAGVVLRLQPAQAEEIRAVRVARHRLEGCGALRIFAHDPEPDAADQRGPGPDFRSARGLAPLRRLGDHLLQGRHLARDAVGDHARMKKVEPTRLRVVQDLADRSLLPLRHAQFSFQLREQGRSSAARRKSFRGLKHAPQTMRQTPAPHAGGLRAAGKP